MRFECGICKTEITDKIFFNCHGDSKYLFCMKHRCIRKEVKEFCKKCQYCGIYFDHFQGDRNTCEICFDMLSSMKNINELDLSKEKKTDLILCIKQYFDDWTKFKCKNYPILMLDDDTRIVFKIESYLKYTNIKPAKK